MKKLRLDLDGLTVESFRPGDDDAGEGTVAAHDATCSKQPTCGAMSRGEETFKLEANTRYACCA
jgi:hypothetical protein